MCTCLPGQVQRYKKRVSGPIIDRIDIHLGVPEVKTEKLVQKKSKKTPHQSAQDKTETSRAIRKRVQQARNIQVKKFKKLKLPIVSNAEMSNKQIKKTCPLDVKSLRLLHQAMNKMNMSARSYFRIIRLARTIADLAGEENIKSGHIAEAIQYRPREEEI